MTAPRLTRLELHGFKSFASRTVFRFEPGITAVIGPNGSGKSNVADAVRWVLGETSHGALRSRRTEDVIFAGGKGRGPVGLAEVAVTFDNATGWLPIAFAEVTVTRRAYRTGENQYLINGRRVRLKDVHQLVASLGQSYTVVGQGLIDAALSQRPEERRGLFEHAADLTGLRLRAAEAGRNLADAETNATRIADLLAELEPRLKTLERAARQAREWQGLADRLRLLQREHYGCLYRDARARLAEAESIAERDGDAVAAAQTDLTHLQDAAVGAQRALDDARNHLAAHDARLTAVADQARRAGHERDLVAERHAALSRRREDMADTQTGLDEQVAAVGRDLVAVATELTGIRAKVDAARARVTDLRRDEATAGAAHARLERRAADLARTLADGERRAADIARRRALLAQRRESETAERDRLAAQIAERAERLDRLAAELDAFDEAATADDAALAALAARLAALAADGERAQAAVADTRLSVRDAEQRLGQATARLDVLCRLHESGTGLFAGVRATLQAARAGTLSGIRGTVAELIEVPAAYDTAIEVALGGHLQDIIVERWSDAEAAIAHLKRTGAGRATFQPLDTLKDGKAGRWGGGETRRRGDGKNEPLPVFPSSRLPISVHGVAADLVGAAPEVAVVVRALLGRTLVVEDMAAARDVLPTLAGGWSVVTLAREIARTGGSVTGGAAVRESGALGRERELRELPGEVERLAAARDLALAAQETAAAELRRLAEASAAVEAEKAGVAAAKKERAGQRARLASWQEDLRREQAAAERRLAGLTGAATDQDGDDLRLAEADAVLAAATARAQEEHAASLADLSREADAAAQAERALAVEGKTLATLEERLRAERRRRAGLQAQERALADEIAHRAERAAALDGERTALAAQHARLGREAAALASEQSMLQTGRAPHDASVRRAETESTHIAREIERARESLLAAERTYGAAELAAERAQGELATIAQRIRDDLELDPDELGRRDGGTAGRREGADSSPPSRRPDPLPPDVEGEIARLKERLRRVGYVGEDVVAEFERESEHQGFLHGQLSDVQGAAASLRELLAELERTMRERFDATFARVAASFTEAFTTLFGGGTARLVLAAGEDGSPGGVDIVAQPPGKRLQGLALLSGGERALTAAALLIAILRVNPTPFCLLDEVDAALDEANVVRFREQLQGLARETQVIVITHNRGTIEIADTLYGVSMGDDGVSQVLSLRLTEAVGVP